MTGSERDRRRRSDPRESPLRSVTTRPWTAVTAFALVVLIGSVVPVPSAQAGAGTAGAVGSGVGAAVGLVAGALPAGVGLTAPFHLLGSATLAALLVRVAGRRRRGAGAAVALAATAATAFGFGIELVQAPIPWRSFAWGDVAVNAVGALAGAGAFRLWLSRRNGRKGLPGNLIR